MLPEKARFSCMDEMFIVFDRLKERFTHPPVLAFPDSDAAFLVETDASSVAVEAVLAQKR